MSSQIACHDTQNDKDGSTSVPTKSSIPPLGPLARLPSDAQGLKQWKILVFCTAINSFSQRVITYFEYLGMKNVSVVIATTKQVMEDSAERFQPDLVVCPFLTAIIPDSIFSKYITLVVHPGPPGDAGPSSLDWVLLGDTGSISDSGLALQHAVGESHDGLSIEERQRSHWGMIVFQASEELDGGHVWAWDQYPLPPLGTITKASLYQNQHSSASINALTLAIIRVYTLTSHLAPDERIKVKPEESWQKLSVTGGLPFQGGMTHERPVLSPKNRKPDWKIHSAHDILRIVNASDSQPGAQLAPPTSRSKTALFIYGAHLHAEVKTIPATIYNSIGYETYEEIPDGTPIATRSGAVFFKTRQSEGSVGIWLTHGRVPKKLGQALEPKIPLVEAIAAAGHGDVLKGIKEWDQASFDLVEGTWQEVYVKTLITDGQLAQLVYWDFYNGAFSTTQCQTLLRALQWAVAPERGNVKILALMGGAYFSNGIALNTIENAQDPGMETWYNINAIDDIVEFLVSDTSAERSPFMAGSVPLFYRGIVTVACLRGNAAAGGVALASGCDVVMAARGVVLNPAYRGMGLHGSEFHSFSYLERCGPDVAASMLRDMLPQSSSKSLRTGLVDIEVGTYSQTRSETLPLFMSEIRNLLSAKADMTTPCAPWCKPTERSGTMLQAMTRAKKAFYSKSQMPLLHYRNEELSQMILDSKHPVRSKRYHIRRYAFIRKVKNQHTKTPSRYLGGLALERDEEELESFDHAPGWTRGDEWAWVGLSTPKSMATSECTRIRLYSPDRGCRITEEPEEVEGLDKEIIGFTEPIEGSIKEAETGREPTPSIQLERPSSPITLSVPRKDSSYSQSSSSSSLEAGCASLASIESIPYPHTPPGMKSPKHFFKRKEEEEEEKAAGRFKSFTKRLSVALRPGTSSRENRKSIPSFQSKNNTPDTTRAGVDGLGMPGGYVQPVIPGSDQVEFPCLYEVETRGRVSN